MSRRNLLRTACAGASIAAGFAFAGGPLHVCNHAPVKYPGAGTITLNYDQGGLGTRSKPVADALIASAAALWTDVPTSSVTLARGPDLPADVTLSNLSTYLDNFSDGLTPVIYDSDGSITEVLLGTGQRSSVLAFGGESRIVGCQYTEGQMIVNGYPGSVDDVTYGNAIAHELGHLIGLDHSQLPAPYPLMYPYPYHMTFDLAADDAASVSALYPDATAANVYGALTSYLYRAFHASGSPIVPIVGGNIVAFDVNTGARFSTVSGYLVQDQGRFDLRLPDGTYGLYIEPINSAFTGELSVGPGVSAWVPSTRLPLGVRFSMRPGCSLVGYFQTDGVAFSRFVSEDSCPRGMMDLGGNARSALLYRNVATGRMYRMFMNGLSITDAAFVYDEPNLAWKVVADADFNGDGVADLLWRNDATGDVYVLFFHTDGKPWWGGVVYNEPNPDWKIVATPDFDEDGMADILWWNAATGEVYAMVMNGLTIAHQRMIYREPDTNWRIVAAGKFLQGRRNELLWHNAVTGQVSILRVVYHTDVDAWLENVYPSFYQEPNIAWKIVAAADFDGDGHSDILWRNDATGDVYLMLMTNMGITHANFVYREPDLDWKIVAAGDYDGDGKADILWRNATTGQVYMMLMNGLVITAQAPVYTEPNTDWRLLGPEAYSH